MSTPDLIPPERIWISARIKTLRHPLHELARNIRSAQERIDRHICCITTAAREAGDALIEARANCGHGEWLPFLADCTVSERTALRYMKLARYAIEHPEQTAELDRMSLRAALSHIDKANQARVPDLNNEEHPEQPEQESAQRADEPFEEKFEEPFEEPESASDKILSRAEFQLLCSVCHPDRPDRSVAQLTKAFQILQKLQQAGIVEDEPRNAAGSGKRQ